MEICNDGVLSETVRAWQNYQTLKLLNTYFTDFKLLVPETCAVIFDTGHKFLSIYILKLFFCEKKYSVLLSLIVLE